MLNFSILAFRSIALIATLISVFITLPMIFAFESVLMFPMMVSAVFGYAVLFYWQVLWFVGGSND